MVPPNHPVRLDHDEIVTLQGGDWKKFGRAIRSSSGCYIDMMIVHMEGDSPYPMHFHHIQWIFIISSWMI